MLMSTVIVIYLILINLLNVILFGYDKHRSIAGKWRVREMTFFLIALLGGSLGGVIGMILFHHKTRKPAFRTGMPLLLAFDIFLLILFL